MFNVKIGNILVPEGRFSGEPCTFINFLSENGEEMDMNAIVEKPLSNKFRLVLIKGHLKSNPGIKDIISGLANKGKIVIFATDETDTIEPLRMFRNVRILLQITPPTEKTNNIDPKNLPLLREGDEIKINLRNLDDYATAKIFLGSRTITQPNVLFSLREADNPLEIIVRYFEDCEKFIFKHKISMPIKFHAPKN